MQLREAGPSKVILMNADEMDMVLNMYGFGSDRWILFSLLGRCGLETLEALNVSPSDIMVDRRPRLLEVEDREAVNRVKWVPIPDDLAASIRLSDGDTQSNRNAGENKQDEPVVNVNERTVREWAKRHTDELIERTGNEEWQHLSPKSFRQSWGRILLDDGIPPHLVMRWGGWHDPKNFYELYIGDQQKSNFSRIYESDLFNSKEPARGEGN